MCNEIGRARKQRRRDAHDSRMMRGRFCFWFVFPVFFFASRDNEELGRANTHRHTDTHTGKTGREQIVLSLA